MAPAIFNQTIKLALTPKKKKKNPRRDSVVRLNILSLIKPEMNGQQVVARKNSTERGESTPLLNMHYTSVSDLFCPTCRKCTFRIKKRQLEEIADRKERYSASLRKGCVTVCGPS